MEYKTSISKMTADDHLIRGEKLSSMMHGSFSDAVFLIVGGRKPTEQESKIFNALLVSVIDHGMGTASALSARFVASAGNSLNAAVAAGVLALGDLHGGSIEKGMIQLAEVKMSGAEKFVTSALASKTVVYGFGHKIYKESDPRVIQVLGMLSEVKYQSWWVDLVVSVEQELEKQKGKKLPLNIDGLMAALFMEFGFSPAAGRGVFIAARVPGLIAQAVEEIEQERSLRRVDEEEITYQGAGNN